MHLVCRAQEANHRGVPETIRIPEGVKGQLGRALGELVTAAVLYRETMAPTLRVQIALKGAGESGTLLADSHPDGWARGLVQRKADAPPFELGEGAMM